MRRFKVLASLVFACALVPDLAQSESYPSRPIKLYVGFAPGGATDQLARLYAGRLTDLLGQPVVVENRPGSGGNVAVQQLTQASPDGYSLVMGANYVAVNAAFKRNPYDWQRDLAPISLIASTPNLLVVPTRSRFHSIDDIAQAGRQPGTQITFGSPGVGSSVHLAGELFKQTAQSPGLTHVPYKGVAPAELDLVAGTIDLMFDSISTAVPLVEAGKLRAIAVTGTQRLNALPDVPTMEELGMKPFNVEATYMVLAPARTPGPIVQKLSAAIAEVSRQPEVRRSVEHLYARPLSGGPTETEDFLKAEEAKWTGVVRASGIRFE